MGSSRRILHELATDTKWKNTQVAYVSRTTEPEWANECLELFAITDKVSMGQLAAHHEIYPGTKTTHFKRIQNESKIPYSEMVVFHGFPRKSNLPRHCGSYFMHLSLQIFFDNEHGNIRDVGKLGVTCIYTPDGMTDEVWEAGLQKFAKERSGKS